MPVNVLYAAQHRLIRSLKLRDYFNDADNDDFDFKIKTFTHKSTWTPADHKLQQSTLNTIQDIIAATESVIRRRKRTDNGNILLWNHDDNLTASERTALRELGSNHDIVIKPADKGSATVIMDKAAYVTEVRRQLDNTKYYRELPRPIYLDNIPKINAILTDMANEKIISHKQLKFLRATEADRQRVFYLLPKIHKPRDKWPQPDRMPEGRPIVSDCGSESYRVCQYIDSFIRPISVRHIAYIKDTYDFVAKVRHQQVPIDALLITGDVTALYTNMDIDRIMSATRRALRKYSLPGRPDRQLMELLDLTLRNNDFAFDDKSYLQTCGTAMGKTYAPALADIYMEDFDEGAMHGFHIEPLLYFRFLDDFFLVWIGTADQARDYETYLNGLIPGIKVTLNVSAVSVNFLDTTIYKEATIPKQPDLNPKVTTLLSRVYFKDTDTHQLLHKASFHPRHTAKGVLKSQVLRFQRISSSFEDFSDACRTLFRSLRQRGYSARAMRKMKTDVWRAGLTGTTLDRERPPSKDKLLPVVVPFNEIGERLAREWRQLVEKNSLFSEHHLITAYTAGRNLRRNLVRSRFADGVSRTIVQCPTSHLSGSSRCASLRCQACSYINETASVRSRTNCKHFTISGRINCKTTCVIYLITCRFCNLQYVGETSRTLADRINDHLSRIRTHKDTPVALHFNGPGHFESHFSVSGIERIVEDDVRRMKELTWQNLLQTAHPLGFNNLTRYCIT
jgi:hypothetical protein